MDYEDIIDYEYKGSRRPDKMSSRNRALPAMGVEMRETWI